MGFGNTLPAAAMRGIQRVLTARYRWYADIIETTTGRVVASPIILQ